MNTRNVLAVAAAAALLLTYLAWDWYLSPHAQVERVLQHAASAAEEKNVEEFLACVSPDFTGLHNMDYELLAEQLQEGIDRFDRLNVTLRRVLAEVDGTEATASFDLTVVAIRNEQRFVILGTLTQPERLEAHLRRGDDGWKIHRVEQSSEEEREE